MTHSSLCTTGVRDTLLTFLVRHIPEAHVASPANFLLDTTHR